jgi:hypothetical protein
VYCWAEAQKEYFQAPKLALAFIAALLAACVTAPDIQTPWVEPGRSRAGTGKWMPIRSDRIVVLDASTEAMSVIWMQSAGVDFVSIREVDAEIADGAANV